MRIPGSLSDRESLIFTSVGNGQHSAPLEPKRFWKIFSRSSSLQVNRSVLQENQTLFQNRNSLPFIKCSSNSTKFLTRGQLPRDKRHQDWRLISLIPCASIHYRSARLDDGRRNTRERKCDLEMLLFTRVYSVPRNSFRLKKKKGRSRTTTQSAQI